MGALLIFGLLLVAVAGFLFWKRRGYSQRMNVLRRAVPTNAADVENAFPGEVVAVEGTARNDQELLSEQTKTPCVYYDYKIVRRYERRRGMVSAGRRGRRRHGGRQRGRETVAQHRQSVPFFVEDKSGRARVDPDGAFFEARQVLNRYEPERQQWNSLGVPGLDISIGRGNRTLGHEYAENVIPADSPVFVAGVVGENGEISNRNGRGEAVGMVVSHRNESALRDEWGKRENWYLYGAIAAAGIGLFLWLIGAIQLVVQTF
jgi:hypothetical protein